MKKIILIMLCFGCGPLEELEQNKILKPISCIGSCVGVQKYNTYEEWYKAGCPSINGCKENLKKEINNCCKICSFGKACGDSCIPKNYNCYQSPGCACNG